MCKWLKVGLIAALGLIIVGACVVAAGLVLAERKTDRRVAVSVAPLAYKIDASALERGRYLFASRGCVDCHGADGLGHMFVDDGAGTRLRGPNITAGRGSVVMNYQPEDWVRAIRNGVGPNGRPLRIMPSEDYNRLTDEDLASLVSYIRSLPPGEGSPALIELPLPVRVLYGLGLIRDSVDKIDHEKPPQQPVEEGVNLAHGAYVANLCLGCHGVDLTGGSVPGGPPDWPPAPNLTPVEGGGMSLYKDATAFAQMFRSGHRPDGSKIQVMPFESLREFNDTDLQALHLYLSSLPARRRN